MTGAGAPLRLAWDRGEAMVTPLSAAIHHLALRLPDGRRITPLAEAPWHDDEATVGDVSIAAHLRHLGGEWPCVPFGRTSVDPVTHGYGTDQHWTIIDRHSGAVSLGIDYPDAHPVARLTRTIAGVPGEARVAFTLTVETRAACRLPVGLHPIARLPDGEMALECKASHGETFPVVFEDGISRLAAGKRFADTSSLPLAGGGSIALGELARLPTEEAVQLFGVDGHAALRCPGEGYRLILDWDASHFPTLLLWLSAGGRTAKPWRGRFRGLGIEPLDATFEARDGSGVIAGGRQFAAGERWTTSYSIGADAG